LGVDFPDVDPGSQPDLEDPSTGGASGEGGEIADKVSRANPEAFVPPINPFNSIIMFHNPGDKLDSANAVGNLKSGELNRISDVLDGSSKYVQKCSLNDIMFLVMLIIIKATSEQRKSRFENMSAKKAVTAKAAITVYELKMSEAKATYAKEKEAAELKKTMAVVSMGCAIVSIAAAGMNAVSSLSSAISTATKATLQTISMVTNLITSLANAVATIAQGVIGLDLAKKGKAVAFIQAEATATQSFFENTMKRVRSMQEAYSSSQRNITSSLQSMQEILEKQQNARLSVARNI
jgi:hypothetical protein